MLQFNLKTMKRAKIGDVFSVETIHGLVLIQYVYEHNKYGQLIRVFENYVDHLPVDISKVPVESENSFLVFFPVKGAQKRGNISLISNFPVQKFSRPSYMKNEYWVNGKFSGWVITELSTLKRSYVKRLKSKHKSIFPWGVWGDELLIDVLNSKWKFKEWNGPTTWGL